MQVEDPPPPDETHEPGKDAITQDVPDPAPGSIKGRPDQESGPVTRHGEGRPRTGSDLQDVEEDGFFGAAVSVLPVVEDLCFIGALIEMMDDAISVEIAR